MRIKNVCFPSCARLPVALCLFVLLAGVSARTDASPSAGTSRQVGAIALNITAVTIDATGQPFLRPPRDRAFLIIDMVAENTGDEDVALSSFLSFKLFTSAGQERELATMYRTNGTMDATLRPGGRVVGQLAYVVPAGDRTFQLETRIGSVFNPTVDRVPLTVD